MSDLVRRLRNTPNWKRESYGSWKDCVLTCDRAPFEAADELERLTSENLELQAKLEEARKDAACICKGNWRQIVAEEQARIGKLFRDDKGGVYRFFGVVHGDDDYYYGMHSETGRLMLLSCVGSIEGFGFEMIDAAMSQEKRKDALDRMARDADELGLDF